MGMAKGGILAMSLCRGSGGVLRLECLRRMDLLCEFELPILISVSIYVSTRIPQQTKQYLYGLDVRYLRN